MTQNLPEWLNQTFLEAALQGEDENNPKKTVEDFSAELAVAAGNNYSSQMFRVVVKYREEASNEKSITLIVKAPHPQLSEMKELGGEILFLKEPIMYSTVLPKMIKLMNCEFGPTTFFSTQKYALVLQDLKETGYVMCDKFKQQNYAHCEIVLKTLAKFHAASVALHGENSEEIEKLGAEPIFTEGNPFMQMLKPLVAFAIGTVTETLKKSDGCELALQFFLDRQEKLYDSLMEICKPKAVGLNVLNHGDLWNNNMLFKYTDAGDVEDVKFIDYQVLRYMSPAIDILYYTWTSADEEVRENRLQELYDVYIQTLNDSLEQLNCEQRYTSEELWQDMKSSLDFALAIICQTFPLMQVEEHDAFDVAEFDVKEFLNVTDTSAIDPKLLGIYNGKHFKAKVPTIIKQIQKTFQ